MITRRQLVKAASVAAVAYGIGKQVTGAQDATLASGIQEDGTWSFVDDRGVTVSLPEMPTRIFAETGAGIALWELGITPIGLCGYTGSFTIPDELADIPFFILDSGELDMEQFIALNPDLSIGQAWSSTDPHDFGAMDERNWPGFTDVAPTLCILAVAQPVNLALDRFAELAGALGADLSVDKVAADRAGFDAACDEVRAAAAEKPDLKVMAFSPTPDSVWIGNPESASDLLFFAELGVNVVAPGELDAAVSELWKEISWEEIGSYPVDLYLNDDPGNQHVDRPVDGTGNIRDPASGPGRSNRDLDN